ncbi:MAG: choice-of-anchor D domain-containing protein [Deltaproteobacteria bacterium]|nr:choice-of-anchor D domain-containing protein [Deltaproteobacteria bacterium]
MSLILGFAYQAWAFSPVEISYVVSGNMDGPAHHGLIVHTAGISDPNLTFFEIQIKPDTGRPVPSWRQYSAQIMPIDGKIINVPYRNGRFVIEAGERYCIRVRAIYGNTTTGWDQQCGIDLAEITSPSGDSDEDGLDDSEEYSIGTDPLDPDSDGDETADGTEVANGTDPNDPPVFPNLIIRTAAIDFGEGDIFGNRRNQHQYIEIQNVGDAAAHIENVAIHAEEAALAGVFHVGSFPSNLSNIPPDDTLRIPVSFIPAAAGPVSARAQVVSNNPEPLAEIVLTGTGDDRLPTCGVSPSSLDFGTVAVEDQEPAVKYVTFSNDPPQSDLSFEFTLTSTVESMAPGLRQFSVKPGEKIDVPVLFQHAEAGSYEGFLEVRSAYCGVQRVTLRGVAE